jgi:hypothetical protein
LALRNRKKRFCKTKFVQPIFNFVESLNRLNVITRNVKGKVEFYGEKKLIWHDWEQKTITKLSGKIRCRKITNVVIRDIEQSQYKGSQNIIVSRYIPKCNFIYDKPIIKMRRFLCRFSRNSWTFSSNTGRSLISNRPKIGK